MIRIPTSSGMLFAGPVTHPDNLDHYDIIWNLASELSFLVEMEQEHADSVLEGNVSDYSIPTDVGEFTAQLRMVLSCLRGGGKVFIHCQGGVGRTGTAVALVLSQLGAASADDALRTTYRLLGGPETRLQWHFVKHLAKKL